MKNIATTALLLLAINSFAQQLVKPAQKDPKSEISVLYNFGVSDRNFQLPTSDMMTRLDYKNAKTLNDQGVLLKYNHTIVTFGKNKFSLGTGVGYFNSKHCQNIAAENGSGYLLDAVVFDSKMITVPVTVSYERSLIDNRLYAELSYSRNSNSTLERNSTYKGQGDKKFGYIDYKYQVDVRRGNSNNHQVCVASKLKVKKNLYVNGSMSYLSSKKTNYNFEYEHLNTLTDAQTGAKSYQYNHVRSQPDIEIKDNYIYLSLGVSYKF